VKPLHPRTGRYLPATVPLSFAARDYRDSGLVLRPKAVIRRADRDGLVWPKAERRVWSKRDWEAAVHAATPYDSVSTQHRRYTTCKLIVEPDVHSGTPTADPGTTAVVGTLEPRGFICSSLAIRIGFIHARQAGRIGPEVAEY
jgi:hypothetical protein